MMDWKENHGVFVGGNLDNSGAIATGPGASATVRHGQADDPKPDRAVIRVFISYRSRDEPATAMLLKRELSRQFGDDNVFIDKGMIPPGSDFEHGLLRRVRRSDVLLAVIGPRWLTVEPDAGGGPAINHHDDWVRREIAEAFASGVPVVPILVNDAARLTDASLPEDVIHLRKCQYLTLRHSSTDADLAKIVDQLVRHVGGTPARRP